MLVKERKAGCAAGAAGAVGAAGAAGVVGAAVIAWVTCAAKAANIESSADNCSAEKAAEVEVVALDMRFSYKVLIDWMVSDTADSTKR